MEEYCQVCFGFYYDCSTATHNAEYQKQIIVEVQCHCSTAMLWQNISIK